MPRRKVLFSVGEYYHVFNRGIEKQSVFRAPVDYNRFLRASWFYKKSELKTNFSTYLRLTETAKKRIEKSIEESQNLVEIISYCLMPNHFHFLVRQSVPGGVSRYFGNLQNSYVKYFNTRNEREGNLFVPRFKAVLITSEPQLLHTSRYIHLNPFVSEVVENLFQTEKYPYSSLGEYLFSSTHKIVDPETMLAFFEGDRKKYRKFVFDNASHQKDLEEAKKALSFS